MQVRLIQEWTFSLKYVHIKLAMSHCSLPACHGSDKLKIIKCVNQLMNMPLIIITTNTCLHVLWAR